MERKLPTVVASICYTAAACLSLLAALLFAKVVKANPAWIAVGAGSILVAVALYAQRSLTELHDQLVERWSEREILNAQLDEQRKAIDSLADGLDVALFICEERASILYANRRACEMFGYERPAGRTVLAITLSYDLEQLVRGVAQSREPQASEIVFTYPKERVGLCKAWAEEGASRVFLSIYEITDLRRLERVRQDFVANVSHELRTPMTVIRAYAETLLDEDPPTADTATRYLPRIISEVDRLSTITQDLLILSAAESNPVRKQSCDIVEVVRNTIQQLSIKAEEKGLQLSYEGPNQLVFEANSSQMTQVAMNLIDNAINYTTVGGVKIVLTKDHDEVELAVTDTGIGIGSEHVSRIFERFYRVDKGRSRQTGGTGLGLSIIKHIVEAHGGHINIESTLNRGTTFVVRLPEGDVNV